jgi:hypothetical protein
MEKFDEKDFSESFSFGIWKKILKRVIKRKKALVLMLLFVSCLALLDIFYPLMNK